jgi:hypothetical protein
VATSGTSCHSLQPGLDSHVVAPKFWCSAFAALGVLSDAQNGSQVPVPESIES